MRGGEISMWRIAGVILLFCFSVLAAQAQSQESPRWFDTSTSARSIVSYGSYGNTIGTGVNSVFPRATLGLGLEASVMRSSLTTFGNTRNQVITSQNISIVAPTVFNTVTPHPVMPVQANFTVMSFSNFSFSKLGEK
jgi:hypothetical protein